MGFYIETPSYHGKAAFLVLDHGGKLATPEEAREAMKDPALGVICVVDNGPFEAAGFCYNQSEFETFSNPHDTRPRTWVIMPRKTAKTLSHYYYGE